jgi:NAD(P)-dependent dehydrogenase (short-subunit alcohol dehydrogenase family)
MEKINFGLSGHSVIFGASGGIGGKIASMIAGEEGVKYISFTYGGNKVAAEQLADSLRLLGVGVYYASVNLSSEVAVNAFLAQAVAAHGGEEISTMVNSVGISPNKPLLEQKLESDGGGDDKGWRDVFEINVNGSFITTRAVASRMKSKGIQGSIVLITSTNGINSYSQISAHYDSSKAAQAMMMRIMAEEFAPYGIRINGVAPGWINTKLNDTLPDEERAHETTRIKMARWAEPEEIALPTVYLLSSGASYICGQNIMVDGCYRA